MVRRGISRYELMWALKELRNVVRAKRSRYVGLRDFKVPRRGHIVIGHLFSILEAEGLVKAVRNGRPLKYELRPLTFEALIRCKATSEECESCSLKRYCPHFILWILLET